MKRIIGILVTFIVLILTVVGLLIVYILKSNDSVEPNHYDIYKNACDAGYSGTFEEWMTLINGKFEDGVTLEDVTSEYIYDETGRLVIYTTYHLSNGKKINKSYVVPKKVKSLYTKEVAVQVIKPGEEKPKIIVDVQFEDNSIGEVELKSYMYIYGEINFYSVGNHNVQLNLNGYKTSLNINVIDSNSLKIKDIVVNSNTTILVANNTGTFDCDLEYYEMEVKYNIEGENKKVKLIDASIEKPKTLHLGLNRITGTYNGFVFEFKVYYAPYDYVKNANYVNSNILNRFSSARYGCFVNKSPFIDEYFYLALYVNGTYVSLYKKLTMDLIEGFNNKVITNKYNSYNIKFMGHIIDKINIMVINDNLELDYLYNITDYVPLNSNIDSILAKGVYKIGDNEVYVKGNLIDFYDLDIDLTKTGKYRYNIHIKDMNLQFYITVYDPNNLKVVSISSPYAINVNNINAEKFAIHYDDGSTKYVNGNKIKFEYDSVLIGKKQLVNATYNNKTYKFTTLLYDTNDSMIKSMYISAFSYEEFTFSYGSVSLDDIKNKLIKAVFRVNYYDGFVKEEYTTLPIESFDLSKININKIGKQVISYTYCGYTGYIPVEILPTEEMLKGNHQTFTQGEFQTIMVYDTFVKIIRKYPQDIVEYCTSEYTYDEKTSVIAVSIINENAFMNNIDLLYKIDKTNKTFKSLEISDEKPLVTYNIDKFFDCTTINLYKDNRISIVITYNGEKTIFATGKYIKLADDLICFDSYYRFNKDGTCDCF